MDQVPSKYNGEGLMPWTRKDLIIEWDKARPLVGVDISSVLLGDSISLDPVKLDEAQAEEVL